MRYAFKGVIERTVQETFDLEITASDVDEAEDLLYEILSEYPNSVLVADKMLKVAQENVGNPSVVSLTVEQSDTDIVFDDVEEDDPA